jgi:16S rRNA (adenine1518-N6/adenine1519-N6)-dimethyltransferase
MKLSEMRGVLARDGIQLTKSLGQNFLHDANQLRRIVAAAELTGEDRVIEIGPGLGVLTELLLGHAGQVLAIEKDARLVKRLGERFAADLGRTPGDSEPAGRQRNAAGLRVGSGSPRLELRHEDALEFLKRQPRDWSQWKLVSNLPYSVASPLLVEMARGAAAPKRMVATVQLEVAKRLLALPGHKDYGLLTLLVQVDFTPLNWFKIPAGCFFPPPKVDSACVTLLRRPAPLLAPASRTAFVRIVKRAFSQRRKIMLKLLKEDWDEAALRDALARLGLHPQIRAEDVGLDEFVRLTRLLHSPL